jgi:hypothetical protein
MLTIKFRTGKCTAFGSVAGIFLLFMFSDVPKVRNDILQVKRIVFDLYCDAKTKLDIELSVYWKLFY